MNLLDLVRRHRQESAGRNGEQSEQSEGTRPAEGDNSLPSLSSPARTAARPEAERCAEWLLRYVRGRYPKLSDVRAAAATAGFSAAAVGVGLRSADLVVYRSFPRRHIGEVEHVRTVDDWPDDPPVAGRSD